MLPAAARAAPTELLSLDAPQICKLISKQPTSTSKDYSSKTREQIQTGHVLCKKEGMINFKFLNFESIIGILVWEHCINNKRHQISSR